MLRSLGCERTEGHILEMGRVDDQPSDEHCGEATIVGSVPDVPDAAAVAAEERGMRFVGNADMVVMTSDTIVAAAVVAVVVGNIDTVVP